MQVIIHNDGGVKKSQFSSISLEKNHDLPICIYRHYIQTLFYTINVHFYRGYDEHLCYLASCENSSAIHYTLYLILLIGYFDHIMQFVIYSRITHHKSFPKNVSYPWLTTTMAFTQIMYKQNKMSITQQIIRKLWRAIFDRNYKRNYGRSNIYSLLRM